MCHDPRTPSFVLPRRVSAGPRYRRWWTLCSRGSGIGGAGGQKVRWGEALIEHHQGPSGDASRLSAWPLARKRFQLLTHRILGGEGGGMPRGVDGVDSAFWGISMYARRQATSQRMGLCTHPCCPPTSPAPWPVSPQSPARAHPLPKAPPSPSQAPCRPRQHTGDKPQPCGHHALPCLPCGHVQVQGRCLQPRHPSAGQSCPALPKLWPDSVCWHESKNK